MGGQMAVYLANLKAVPLEPWKADWTAAKRDSHWAAAMAGK